MNELRPCPLCPIDEANPPQLFSISGLGFMSYVLCPICLLETQRYETRAEAVAAWNHRPVEDALIEALRSCSERLDCTNSVIGDVPPESLLYTTKKLNSEATTSACAALKLR